MNYIAKEEVENSDSVDGIEDHGSLVEQEFGPGFRVSLWNEPDQIIVHYMTKEDVQSDAQDPS